MAELTFRSPGVGTREIDLSGPTAISPQGTPAGVVGTAQQGPAFVPQTFATWQDFVAIFGSTDGEKLGPLAMYEWMKNSRAGTYLRVLGVGTGAKRLAAAGSDSDSNSLQAGAVKNAGFTVGQRQVRGNGYLGNNDYAWSTAETLGRTYMLGAFMSESNGSTFLSDSGIQQASTKATASITLGNSNTGTECVNATTVTITDNTGAEKVYEFLNDGGTASGTNIKVSDGSGDINLAQNQVIAAALVTAIEANQNIDCRKLVQESRYPYFDTNPRKLWLSKRKCYNYQHRSNCNSKIRIFRWHWWCNPYSSRSYYDSLRSYCFSKWIWL